MSKEEIVLYNKNLGIETIFSSELETVGKAEGKVIYLNDNFENLGQINKHEVLHFYEDTIQFKKIKEIILNCLKREELDRLRKEYRSLYFPLYKNEKNVEETIDNEIVIDFIIKDRVYSISIDQIVKDCFEVIVKSSNKMTINKRYLNISLSKKIDGQYPRLSKWEKLFILNYYTKGLPNGENKYETIKNDISSELQKLYQYADNEENFVIDYKDNKYLEKEFEGEIEALKARGEQGRAEYCLKYKDRVLQEMAKRFSETQQVEYKHIIGFIRNTDYEDSFKYLMLKETLTKIYKLEKVNGDTETIISKRETHKSISGHMTLNEIVLDTIYNNLEDYKNFANLYYAGLAIFNNKISEKSEVNIEGLNTFGKGKWIKFNGKSSDPDNYIKNAQDLSSLVQDTPWCTKTLASVQLEHGDFYVFVDNNNKPHIAVKMNGNEIDEVRGLKNDGAQELEEDYREVAIEFLTKNKDIKYGKEWLEKEEWNKRLINWKKKVEEDTLKEEEIEDLLLDVFGRIDYRAHMEMNSNIKLLLEKMECSKMVLDYYKKNLDNLNYGKIWFLKVEWNKRLIEWCEKIDNNTLQESEINDLLYDLFEFPYCKQGYHSKKEELKKKMRKSSLLLNHFAQITGCKTEEIYLGDICRKDIEGYVFPYKVVVGNVNFSRTKSDIDMKKLKYIYGNADFYCSSNKTLYNLEIIHGDACFTAFHGRIPMLSTVFGNCNFNSADCRIPNLVYVGGNFVMDGAQISEIPNLVQIAGEARFVGSCLKQLPSLQHIGELAYFDCRNLTSLPNLISFSKFTARQELCDYLEANFEKTENGYIRKKQNLIGKRCID